MPKGKSNGKKKTRLVCAKFAKKSNGKRGKCIRRKRVKNKR